MPFTNVTVLEEPRRGRTPTSHNRGIGTWISRRARSAADRVALIVDDRALSYGEFASRITRLGHGLSSLGVRRGDRVGYIGRNHRAALETLFASAQLGAIAVTANPGLSDEVLLSAIEQAGCSVLIVGPGAHASFDRLGTRITARTILNVGDDYESLLARMPTHPIEAPVDPTDICLISFTSGTTGGIKGVALTHENLAYNVFNLLSCADVVCDDILLTAAPCHRLGGLGTMLPVLFKGGTVVLMQEFDAEDTLTLLESHGATIVFNGPAQFDALLRHPRFEQADLSSLRFCLCGGAPLSEATIRTYLARGVSFQQAYGLTEAAPLALLLDRADVHERVGSAGRPPLFCEVRVVTPDGAEVLPGEPGELLLRGPNVMHGYWGRPDLTCAAIDEDGWLRTGDLARCDEAGFIYILDRAVDLMHLDGRAVLPSEVERIVAEFPGVAGCAALSYRDNEDAEQLALFVVPADPPDLDVSTLRRLCVTTMEPHLVPRALHVVPSLPTNANGKLVRGRLRDTIAQT